MYWKKEQKGKTVENKKGAIRLWQLERICPALETRQFHTIEYRVRKTVPQRHWEENRSPAILRGCAAMMRMSKPIRRAPHCRTVLQKGQDKPRKHIPRRNLSWNTHQDILKIPSLWSCSGNRANMLLKRHLWFKSLPIYQGNQTLQHSCANS